ncbi:MAG: hypothetical protein DMD81_16635 [Candidatus Rokuibacteriota bacterium]|nr:MAG: hypothetical protein DMD81_16635 [Candidatus Rokubacteria bacterium]
MRDPGATSRHASGIARALSWGLVGMFVAPLGYLVWASLPWPLIHDAPIMHYLAWRIAEGATPYRDLFDMNQPGLYAIHLAILKLLGAGDLAWRLFDLAALAAACAALAVYARPWGRAAAAGSAALFAVYHLAGGAWQAGQRDFLLCPLLVLGAASVASWIERGSSASSLGWGGGLLGAALTIKPHAALLAVLLAIVIAVAAWRRRALPKLVIFVVGVALAPAVALAWLVARGAFSAWREVTFGYFVPVYTHLSGPERFVIYRWRVWIVIAVAVLLSITSAAWHRRFDARHGIAALGVGYGLVHFLGQGKGWEYQLYPLAAFAAVLAFSEVDLLMRARSFSFGVPIAASLVGIAILLTVKGGEAADAAWIWDKERLVRLVVSDLAARRRSGDLVQVLDTTAGGLHALLRLHAVQPTRFVYDFPLFQEVDEPVVRRFQAEFLRDLTAHPPRFIVVFERGWPRGTYDRVDSFPAFARWLERSYLVVAQRRDGYVIFAQRNDP